MHGRCRKMFSPLRARRLPRPANWLGEDACAHRRDRHRHAVRDLGMGRRGRRSRRADGPLADLRRRRETIREFCPWPVYLQNDATAACGAELAFGAGPRKQDFIYFYVGTFVGGGVVLNGSLYTGHTGNAGALGSMPVPGVKGNFRTANRPGLAGGAGAAVERGRRSIRRHCGPPMATGPPSRPTRQPGSTSRRAALPMPSSRRPRSSTSRRR